MYFTKWLLVMAPYFSSILQLIACIGFGSVVLRILGVSRNLTIPERVLWGFGFGYGVFGWLLFFVGIAGLFEHLAIYFLLGTGVLGLLSIQNLPILISPKENIGNWTFFECALLAVLTFAVAIDLLEGLAPPADADSLAYHFALPKYFIKQGRLLFVERALDGAIPLLNQMT